MFDPTPKPRLYGLAPGIDFPEQLVAGLIARHKGKPPQDLARVRLIVNTSRMARRIKLLFDDAGAVLLPRIELLGDLGKNPLFDSIPAAEPPLRRRMELIQFLSILLESQGDLAPRTALFDLADSLADLMDEMQGEGVSPAVIEALDVSDKSGHWARAKSFIEIVQRYFDSNEHAPDSEARQRMVVFALKEIWRDNPPETPIILAGSTGSRGTTLELMKAVAALPQGAVVLPGYDFDMPAPIWSTLNNALTTEDHPQYRFARLISDLDITPQDVLPWTAEPAPDDERNKVISLALRPAPVTDGWLRDGPKLHDLPSAMKGVTLVTAQTPRQEALCIALRLRQAAEEGQTAALITPDRLLTRQVASALDRWNIIPDDSAGQPLQLTPPGRFLRQVAKLFEGDTTLDALLALLKHPLTHTGEGRGEHLRLSRDLELYLRRKNMAFPQPELVAAWCEAHDSTMAAQWGHWLSSSLLEPTPNTPLNADAHLERHVSRAEKIAVGCLSDGSGELWLKAAGRDAKASVETLAEHIGLAGALSAHDYSTLFGAVLSQGQVRERDEGHPGILIWGTLEARVQGADLLILAGLNEGTWPEAPKADPWLNRVLRHQAGLLLPERRIGLSAHDFQQAACAKEVVLTRATRSDDAETVPSRWVNRLTNLLGGLPGQDGPKALKDMHHRGEYWVQLARAVEAPVPIPSPPRPAPAPPSAARPRKLSVTEIKTLVRDPYAIYARHVLRLRPLNSIAQTADALLRGILLHEIFEHFIKAWPAKEDIDLRDTLLEITDAVLEEELPWPAAQVFWRARVETIADRFIEAEKNRQMRATPAGFEKLGKLTIPELDFTLTARADRVDLDERGGAHLYDYKSGAVPAKKAQQHFDKQLLLMAAMLEKGGFTPLEPAFVQSATFLGLGKDLAESAAPLSDEPVEKIWTEFINLIEKYMQDDMGYSARRALQRTEDISDFDQLSRFGEWDITDIPQRIDLP